jgi:hypothetical protein
VTRLHPQRIGALLALATALHTPPASAQGDTRVFREPAQRARVLLLVDDDDGGIVRRLRVELAELGLVLVTERPAPGATQPRDLEAAARRVDAVAALRIQQRTTDVEVWVRDRMTGKTLLREIVASDADGAERDAMVALQAVELLRASLLELESTLPPRGTAKPPPQVRAAAREALDPASPAPASPSAAWWLGVAGAVGIAGGAGVRPQAALTGQWRFHRWVAIEAGAVVPLGAIGVTEPEATANVVVTSFHLGLDLPLLSPESAFDLRVGAALGATWAHIDTSANAGFLAESDDVVMAWPHGHLAAAWLPTDRLRLTFAARLGAAVPRMVMDFAGRDVLTYGRPLVVLALGPELALD